MSRDHSIITKSPEETMQFGSELACKLKEQDIVALYGDLGSGKTQVVKGICGRLGIEEIVNSPTFIIVNEYTSASGVNIYHFDLYRMRTEEEVLAIGFDDYLNSRGIILIEWPEHDERLLPKSTIRIHLAHTDDCENCRYIRLETPEL